MTTPDQKTYREYTRGKHALAFRCVNGMTVTSAAGWKKGRKTAEIDGWDMYVVDDLASYGEFTILDESMLLTPPPATDAVALNAYIRGVFHAYSTDDNAYVKWGCKRAICVSPFRKYRGYPGFEAQAAKLLQCVADSVKTKPQWLTNLTGEPTGLLWKDWSAIDTVYELTNGRIQFPTESYDGEYTARGTMQVMRTRADAPLPYKVRMSDSGYDLTLVAYIKSVGNVHYYGTGIAVTPPLGYYYELVGRSSIAKLGYMLANNIGVIDATYTGEIIVALVRISDAAPLTLELPQRIVQLLPRQYTHHNIEVVDSLVATARGDTGGVSQAGKSLTDVANGVV